MRFLLFFLVLLAALVAIDVYVHRRVSAAFELGPRARRALGLTLALGLSAMVAGRLLSRALRGSEDLAAGLGALGAAVQLAAIVAFAVLLVERALSGGGRATGWLLSRLFSRTAPPSRQPAPSPETAPEPSAPIGRRDFLSRATTGAALAVGATSSGYASLFGRHDYVIEEVPIRLEKLPPTLDGFTVVQLSDLHLGTFAGDPEIRAALDLVDRARPDLIVLTGDLLDHDVRYAPSLGSLVRRLGERARVIAIPGNHDHYAGLGAIVRHIEQAGGEVLINRGVRVGDRGGRFALLGVDDVWGRRFGGRAGPQLDQALAAASPDDARVLLCHNPVFFPEAAPKVDLQLSGHTHGGQFNLGVRPADWVLPFGYVAGRYTRGEAQLYVNRGFGTAGPPARLGAAPEVTKIVLTA